MIIGKALSDGMYPVSAILAGGFARYAFGGPMKSEPYINPAAIYWTRVLYKQAAAARLRATGFGLGNIR